MEITQEFKTVIGISITAINLLTLVILCTNIVKCYNRASDITKAIKKVDVDFYFLQMFISLIFFFANGIALYTGFMAYIIHPSLVMDDIVMYRFADRFGMFLVSIGMTWQRMRYNPFDDI